MISDGVVLTAAPTPVFVITPLVVWYGTELRQVWQDTYSGKTELRRVPTLEEAVKIYGLNNLTVEP